MESKLALFQSNVMAFFFFPIKKWISNKVNRWMNDSGRNTRTGTETKQKKRRNILKCGVRIRQGIVIIINYGLINYFCNDRASERERENLWMQTIKELYFFSWTLSFHLFLHFFFSSSLILIIRFRCNSYHRWWLWCIENFSKKKFIFLLSISSL